MTAVGPYKDLSPNRSTESASSSPFAPSYVRSHLTQCSDPVGVYASRIQGRSILLENSAQESKAKKARDEKNKRRKALINRKKTGVIGRKEAKVRGVWSLHPSQARFEAFLALHHLWMGYISELLGLPSPPRTPTATLTGQNSASMHAKLIKADYHGSIMTVRQSRNPSLVNLSGIVIHESENAFKIITKTNKMKVLPKQNSIFTFAVPLYSTISPSQAAAPTLEPPSAGPSSTPQQLRATTERSQQRNEPGLSNVQNSTATVFDEPHVSFDLHGNQFCFRAAERAGRKFKWKASIEL